MTIFVPICSRGFDGLLDLLPSFKAPFLECQGAANFPQRLNQIEIGGILGRLSAAFDDCCSLIGPIQDPSA